MQGGRAEIYARADEVRKLVAMVVRTKIKPGKYEMDDLISEGVRGVLENAGYYDPERGSFSTFVANVAHTWIVRRVMIAGETDRRRVNLETISLDMPITGLLEDGNRQATLGDMIPDAGCGTEEAVIRKLERDAVREALEAVGNERIRKILAERYGDQKRTLRDIAAEMGVTKERVRQLEIIGLEQLRVILEQRKMA